MAKRGWKSIDETHAEPRASADRATIEARREMVDTLDCMGVRRAQIIKTLKEKRYLEGYLQPIAVVTKDLIYVRKRRRELLKTGLLDETKGEFVAQQIEVYRAAMKETDYKHSIEASKNIAKARGFNVDKIVIEGGDKDKPIQHKTEHSIDSEEARTILGILREAGGLLPEPDDA